MRGNQSTGDVGYASTAQFSELINGLLDHRTIAEIQKRTIKQGRCNPVPEFFHGKSDGDDIVAWRLKLDKISSRLQRMRSVTFIIDELLLSILF